MCSGRNRVTGPSGAGGRLEWLPAGKVYSAPQEVYGQSAHFQDGRRGWVLMTLEWKIEAGVKDWH